MKTITILSMIAAVGLGFMSYKFTHAYFTASAVSAENIFKTAESFNSQATESAHIVINEVSPLGDNQGEWVELFNPTDGDVDLKNWSITDSFPSSDTLSLSSLILPANEYAVIVTNNTTVSEIPANAVKIVLENATIGNGLTDAGDSLTLKNSTGTVVDKMSYGSDISVFSQPPAEPTSGKTLQRIPNGMDIDTSTDWHVAAPTLGGENQ